MKRAVFWSALTVAALVAAGWGTQARVEAQGEEDAGASLAVSAADEPAGPTPEENPEAFIGRKAVEAGAAAKVGLIRPLPQSCPPFYLRDEFGKIIDPTYVPTDDAGNPLLDEHGQPVKPVLNPVDVRQTCMPCHDVDTITQGYHFQMGYRQMYDPHKLGEPIPLDKSPGFYGKWLLLYQRELAPKHFTDASEIDMTPFDWVVNCGICHPGGGPAEFDRAGKRYSDVAGSDAAMTGAFDGDYYNQPWDKSGVAGPDCFICHIETYDYSLRAQQLKKWNFKWAATEAANFGVVEGAVKDGEVPKVQYNENLFMPDGKVYLKIRRPDDRNCLFCHDLSGVQKRGTTWHNNYVQDVHTQQNIKCIDCHEGDIRHNFAKGHSFPQTVRDDLDNTMKDCRECHYSEAMGAPNYTHIGIPPLHFERMSCEACHITRRPFLMTRVVDTTTGKAIELPNSADYRSTGHFLFGTEWYRMDQQGAEATVDPYTEAEVQAAADLLITADSPVRSRYLVNYELEPLPEGEFTVREFIESDPADAEGGLPIADRPEERLVMLLALETIDLDALRAQDGEGRFYPAVAVFRGQVFRLMGDRLQEAPATLQPDRTSRIEEYRLTYSIFGEDEENLGLYYPEGYQLGVFWAYVDKETGFGKPLFLSDMQTAWDYLNSVNVVLCSGDTTEKLAIWDDNNDRWPEVNTEKEMGLMGWALKRTLTRLENYDLYYIKGIKAYRVTVDDPIPADLDSAVDGAPAVPEGQPFITLTWTPRDENNLPAKNPDGSPRRVTQNFAAYTATVESVDPEENTVIAELAQRLRWSVSHGVEPVTQSFGLGVKGCIDCHSIDSPFFTAKVMVDPFGPDGQPEMVPAYELMGLNANQLRYAHFREVIIKEEGHWLLIAVLALIAAHFIFIGPRPAVPVSLEAGGNVRFFRFHERFAYWLAAGCVAVLGLSAIGFRLTGQTSVGAFVRDTHHVVGIVGSIAFALLFLLLLPYMLPRGYDFNWRWKKEEGLRRPPRSGKFSGGEKLVFWGTAITLAGVAVTGLIIHYNYDVRTANQQFVYMLHDGFAVLAVCFIFVHMYQMILLHPQALRRVFGGHVPAAWVETYRSEWKPAR